MTFNQYVLEEDLGTIESGKSFKELTTIGCGGLIQTLYTPKDISCLIKAFSYIIKHQLNYFIIGNGSNVLASDEMFRGIVIQLKKLPYSYTVDQGILTCSAFYPTSRLAYDLAAEQIGDLSFLGGIPGLLGGAIYNNSGAYLDDISKHLLEVEYLASDGSVKTMNRYSCGFSYRHSVFHHMDAIILKAKFKIEPKETLSLLEKRKKDRLLSQPLDSKNMGSIFKNNPLIPAWKVIDALGMRGFQIGDAAVSVKHSNFIINLGSASAKDVSSLIELIQQRAELEFGIRLFCEISRV